MIESLLWCFGVISIWALILFGISLIKNRNDIADVVWGPNFIICCLVTFWRLNTPPTLAAIVVLLMILVWGTRLAVHIGRRHKGKDEDYRYKAWRESWGKWFYLRSFLQVFLLQTYLAVIVCLPAIAIIAHPDELMIWLVIVGVWIWSNGFIIESTADKQLAEFIKTKKPGQIIKTGLWKYSRHPNYFGELTQWWGIFIMALAIPYGWITILGPLTITFLITKVSGIPLLEKKMQENKEFKEYAQRTSILIPWPPKN